jgi:hypothetical protein
MFAKALIHDVSKTKPTAEGKTRYRFSVAVDLSGHTLLTTGWVYLPHAKAGYRVNPPRRGQVRTIKGVGLMICRELEEAMFAKLGLQGGSIEPDAYEVDPGLVEGEPTWE